MTCSFMTFSDIGSAYYEALSCIISAMFSTVQQLSAWQPVAQLAAWQLAAGSQFLCTPQVSCPREVCLEPARRYSHVGLAGVCLLLPCLSKVKLMQSQGHQAAIDVDYHFGAQRQLCMRSKSQDTYASLLAVYFGQDDLTMKTRRHYSASGFWVPVVDVEIVYCHPESFRNATINVAIALSQHLATT